jgi:peptide/nickel transport system permease protein
MKIISVVFKELFASLAIVLISTYLMFFLAFNAAGDIQKSKMGIDTEKGSIIPYVEWWGAIFSGNIGGTNQANDALKSQLLFGLQQEIILVALAVLFSIILSLFLALFILSHPGTVWSNIIDRLLYLSGALPVFLLAVLIYYSLPAQISNIQYYNPDLPMSEQSLFTLSNIVPFSIAGLVLSFGSGVLGELFRLFKNELGRIMNEPYILSARNRGASIMLHVTRTSIVPLSSALLSKIPYFIGAGIIVEKVFGISGLGEKIYESASEANFAKMMAILLIILSSILVVRLLNKIIIAVYDPRST